MDSKARSSFLFYRASYRKTALHFSGRTLERALVTDGNLKQVKAQVMKAFSDLPVTAWEREAYEAWPRFVSTYP